ncbi:hypothetical protein JKP88DRAFT_348479 [Tribonema minus]|uniref:Ankyrin repeat protein n=1 Tax=Tribonema minus TaxID=303371 RepID=A0A835Z2C7_9STRA|nr:hypothetical protein JKP88DRAFT_348479 [Tribonema minus]
MLYFVDPYAMTGAHLGVLQWARANGCPWDESTCSFPAERGHLAVVQWARANGGPWDEQTCWRAASNGHLAVLHWARAAGCPWDWARANGCAWDARTCASTAIEGHFEVLQWARAAGCPWDAHTAASAAHVGDLAILQWARAGGCPWDAETCSYAAVKGRLHVLQWARANGCPWDERTCSSAAASGHLEVLQWARANGCPWDCDTTYLAKQEHWQHVLDWARANGCPEHAPSWDRYIPDAEGMSDKDCGSSDQESGDSVSNPCDGCMTSVASAAATPSSPTALGESRAVDDTAGDQDREAAFYEMLAWLRAGGAAFPPLATRADAASGWGVYALEAVPPGALLITIPKHLLITLEVAKESEIGRKICEADVELGATRLTLLSIFLLTDRRRAESAYLPYYATLPPAHAASPLFWPAARREALLEGSYTLIQDWEEDLEADYDDVCAAVPELKTDHGITLADFKWARCAAGGARFAAMTDQHCPCNTLA